MRAKGRCPRAGMQAVNLVEVVPVMVTPTGIEPVFQP